MTDIEYGSKVSPDIKKFIADCIGVPVALYDELAIDFYWKPRLVIEEDQQIEPMAITDSPIPRLAKGFDGL